MNIGFCFNIKSKKASAYGAESEYDERKTIDGIAAAIKANGHRVFYVEANLKALQTLTRIKKKIDLVFNIAEGITGDARESQIPVYCEILGIPYTHSSPTVNALSLNKYLAKLAVESLGIKVPRSVLVRRRENKVERWDERLKFPLIIKPNGEGSSVGIFDANVVEDKKQMEKRVAELRKNGLKGQILIEEFIDGREFTVGVLGNDPAVVLPIIEQKFDFLPSGLHRIAGFELKWFYEDKLKDPKKAFDCPAKLTTSMRRKLEQATLKIYEGWGVKDCARIDYRMDKKGELYFLEINTLPGMIPDEKIISYFPLAARTMGLPYTEMVGRIIENARRRYAVRRQISGRPAKKQYKPGRPAGGRHLLSG